VELWRDVPYEEKGAVFQPTFVRGIKCLRLDTLFKVKFTPTIHDKSTHVWRVANKSCKKNPGKHPHSELLARAEEILAELADTPEQPHVSDIVMFQSFFRYQIGKARS
jgi:hypothetical protein